MNISFYTKQQHQQQQIKNETIIRSQKHEISQLTTTTTAQTFLLLSVFFSKTKITRLEITI